ncbi:geranylgeranyl transferase type-2 subunit alpha [Contarinia nasturtii]|uniref:geranylgeranyl transferase type-2 subunit alpha n=1 Tax=Contarinia nasturtii TaxID=265458 RepID=UPI0012D3A483|nr:geranylgeranyl transferase type-2 subunit alpha [Contarinia nasturtii]
MHGRLKVRTTEEEAQRKRNEQALKVKAYRVAMSKIIEKRAAEQYDAEIMQLTTGVLSRNPDVFTLWNIRREFLLKLKADKPDEVQETYTKDLQLTQTCLQVNPKSYCAWHHRCWILENITEPKWDDEVKLCTKYLQLDERNFHVWDYRRYAVKHANVKPEDELEFCTQKIQKNFSNYSSWHQRSKLLPVLYPHETDKTRPINEEILRNELELVLTAAFTDPNDSSAWFYQRWLLGNSEQELDIAAFKLTKTYALIAFTRPVDLYKCSISLDATTKFDTNKWQPIDSEFPVKHYSVWKLEDTFELNNEGNSIFELSFVDEDDNSHSLQITKSNDGLFGIKMPRFGFEFGSGVLNVLQEQLSSCQQLLEYEPESKWTLLTAALLMRAVNRKEYHAASLEFLDKLKMYDSNRTGYYSDLADKWSIERGLIDWISALEKNRDTLIDLSNLNLVNLHYTQYICVANEIKLSGNNFDSKRTNKISTLLGNCNVKNDLTKTSDP